MAEVDTETVFRTLDKYDLNLRKTLTEAEGLAQNFQDASAVSCRTFVDYLLNAIAERKGQRRRDDREKLHKFIKHLIHKLILHLLSHLIESRNPIRFRVVHF